MSTFTRDLKVERCGEYAIVHLCREPVNTMDLRLWKQLLVTLDQLEKEEGIRGAIFVSGLKKDVFTAGNDIGELYAPATTAERYSEFWVLSNKFLQRLYVSPLATVAAIRGACPAGGCCLSLCCDYRVMTQEVGYIGLNEVAQGIGVRQFRAQLVGQLAMKACLVYPDSFAPLTRPERGLNEVALGISVPKFWGQLMGRLIGQGPAERLLQTATMLPPAEALKTGLVDELAPKSDLQAAAEGAMKRLLASPDSGRVETKRLLRGEFAKAWEAYSALEAVGAWRLLSSPEVVAQLGAVLKRLGRSAKPKL